MLTRRQRLELSDRLRSSPTPRPEDIALLGEVLIQHNGAMSVVAEGLRSIGLSPTTRLKTSDTIVDKLKRQSNVNLANMRDLAGARVVQGMTLDRQDEVTAKILELWPDARSIDRRKHPSFGYRAVHIVPKAEGCPVEIQVRTLYQNAWAQVMELFGDMWGRAVRYGGMPNTPDAIWEGTELTRRQWVTGWIEQADKLYELAQLENEHATYTAVQDGESAEGVQRRINEEFGGLQAVIRRLAVQLEQQPPATGRVTS